MISIQSIDAEVMDLLHHGVEPTEIPARYGVTYGVLIAALDYHTAHTLHAVLRAQVKRGLKAMEDAATLSDLQWRCRVLEARLATKQLEQVAL